MNRAERRRQSRAHEKEPVLIAGDGIVAAGLGQQFEAQPSAELPPKVSGKHRWIATAAYVLNDEDVENAFDENKHKILDNSKLFVLGIGCYDCEQPLSVVQGRPCPGDQ
jgi:hypothetical protein